MSSISNFSAELSEAEISSFIENQTCVVFMCGDKTKVPHQLGFQRFDLFSIVTVTDTNCLLGSLIRILIYC